MSGLWANLTEFNRQADAMAVYQKVFESLEENLEFLKDLAKTDGVEAEKINALVPGLISFHNFMWRVVNDEPPPQPQQQPAEPLPDTVEDTENAEETEKAETKKKGSETVHAGSEKTKESGDTERNSTAEEKPKEKEKGKKVNIK